MSEEVYTSDSFKYDHWRQHAIEAIEELKEYDLNRYNDLVSDGDLHNEIFNPSPYIMMYIGTCLEWMDSARGMSDCIDKVLEWEFENVGDIEREIKELKEKPYYHRDNKDSLIFRLWDMVETLSSPEQLVARYAYVVGEEVIYQDLDPQPEEVEE